MLGPFLFLAQIVAGAIPGAPNDSPTPTHATLFSQFVGESVELEIDSHRVVAGVLDERTDDDMVWLARKSDRMTLWSGFPATRVVRCQVVSADPLAAASQFPDEVAPPESASDGGCAALQDDPPDAARQVVSIEVRAEVANLDGDVAPDGLRVWIRPIDRFGQTVAATGQVEFQLLGQRRDWRGGRHDLRGPQFLALQRWSQRIQAADATFDGVQTTLWFRNFSPGRDLDIANNALLLARLSIPGHGVFAASDDRLFLRPWSQLRDDLQQRTESRYFPEERTSTRYRRWPW